MAAKNISLDSLKTAGTGSTPGPIKPRRLTKNERRRIAAAKFTALHLEWLAKQKQKVNY